MKRDLSISFIRVTAMMFIVACHVASFFNQVAVASFFDVGVPMFFLISGYLYGDRCIVDTTSFLFKRYIRLIIPAIIWLAVVCISAKLGRCDFPLTHEIVFLLLNLQGLRFIFPTMEKLFIGPWFFTSIMVCYIIWALYLKVERKHPSIASIFSYGGTVPMILFCILAFLRISLFGVMAFFAGAIIKRRKLFDTIEKKHIIPCAFYFCGAIALRLCCRRLIDGTVLYNDVIAPLSHVVLAGAIVSLIKWVFVVMPDIMRVISSSVIFSHLDNISIYIYVCHTFFIDGTIISLFKLPLPSYLLFPGYIIIIIISSTVMWIIGNRLTAMIDKSVAWLF